MAPKEKKEGYSTTIKMSPEVFKQFKDTVNFFKRKRYARLFTVPDLIEAVCVMPREQLEKAVDEVMSAKSVLRGLDKISPEAKAQIEAILAAEAAKQA